MNGCSTGSLEERKQAVYRGLCSCDKRLTSFLGRSAATPIWIPVFFLSTMLNLSPINRPPSHELKNIYKKRETAISAIGSWVPLKGIYDAWRISCKLLLGSLRKWSWHCFGHFGRTILGFSDRSKNGGSELSTKQIK